MFEIRLNAILALLVVLVPATLRAQPATLPASVPSRPVPDPQIGVIDTKRIIQALGWETERRKRREVVVAEVDRELQGFQDQIKKAVEQSQVQIIRAAKLSPEQADRLLKGDLQQLPLTNVQREELARLLHTPKLEYPIAPKLRLPTIRLDDIQSPKREGAKP